MKNEMPHNPLEGDRPEMSMQLHDGTEEQISIIVVDGRIYRKSWC